MDSDVVLWIVVGTALAFDFTNGFHDTANAVATSISTRAMPPRVAVALAAILNFVGAFLSLAVAATIATGIVNPADVTPPIVFAGLVGAIAWNLTTWYFGLPSSSSHALIGGVVGATLAAAGAGGVHFTGLLDKVVIPALVAPVLAFVVAGIGDPDRLPHRRPPAPGPGRRAASGSGSRHRAACSRLSHGTNDAQKTMGIIFLALVANGNLQADADVPTWVVVSSATAIALGTYVGGWRIIRTMGMPDHQDGPGAGLRRAGRRRRGDPVGLARRLPAVHHARDRAARSWARAPPSGCPPCAGAWPATSSSRGC